jgi:hypothetical protein
MGLRMPVTLAALFALLSVVHVRQPTERDTGEAMASAYGLPVSSSVQVRSAHWRYIASAAGKPSTIVSFRLILRTNCVQPVQRVTLWCVMLMS